METKHTPGPWYRNIKPASKYNTVWAGRNTHVARVVVDGLPDEQVEANINLIAAAPELLAALQAVVANAPDPHCAITRAIDAQCRAAIAEATKA